MFFIDMHIFVRCSVIKHIISLGDDEFDFTK